MALVAPRPADGSYDHGPHTADLQALAVATDHRGRGIGRALLDAARAHAATLGYRTMTFGVMAGNADAERFYDRAGAVAALTVRWLPLRAP